MVRLEAATRNVIGRPYAGQYQIEVAQQFIVHTTTFSHLWQRLNQTRSAQERSRSGRSRIATPTQDWYIGVVHLRNRTVTATVTATGIPCI